VGEEGMREERRKEREGNFEGWDPHNAWDGSTPMVPYFFSSSFSTLS